MVEGACYGSAALKPMRESRVPKNQRKNACTSFLIKVNIPATAPERASPLRSSSTSEDSGSIAHGIDMMAEKPTPITQERIIRKMSLGYPEMKPSRTQFLYGADLLIVPVLKRCATKVKVYIPDDSFVFAYDKKALTKGWHTVKASLSKPVFFYRKGCEVGEQLEVFFKNQA